MERCWFSIEDGSACGGQLLYILLEDWDFLCCALRTLISNRK